MRTLPNWRSVACRDPLCYQLTTIVPGILLIVGLVEATGTLPGGRGKPDVPVSPVVAHSIFAGGLGLCAILLAFVALRVKRVQRLFGEGDEVDATVEKVVRRRHDTRVQVEFLYCGQPRRARTKIGGWKRPPDPTPGTRLALLIDRGDPRRVVSRAVYESH